MQTFVRTSSSSSVTMRERGASLDISSTTTTKSFNSKFSRSNSFSHQESTRLPRAPTSSLRSRLTRSHSVVESNKNAKAIVTKLSRATSASVTSCPFTSTKATPYAVNARSTITTSQFRRFSPTDQSLERGSSSATRESCEPKASTANVLEQSEDKYRRSSAASPTKSSAAKVVAFSSHTQSSSFKFPSGSRSGNTVQAQSVTILNKPKTSASTPAARTKLLDDSSRIPQRSSPTKVGRQITPSVQPMASFSRFPRTSTCTNTTRYLPVACYSSYLPRQARSKTREEPQR
jgi:hypothetical protein